MQTLLNTADGPITTVSVLSSGRKFPLRETVFKMWSGGLGLNHIPDGNGGHPRGITDLVENWKDGKRQIASDTYPLTGMKVLTDTIVRRIIIEDKVAVGVEFASGQKLLVRHGGRPSHRLFRRVRNAQDSSTFWHWQPNPTFRARH
jgi:hypothetical protein